MNDFNPCIENKEEDPKVDHDVLCLDKVLDEISMDVSNVKDQEDEYDVFVCNDNLCNEKEVDANSPQEVKVLPNTVAMHISIFTQYTFTQ